MYVCMYLYPNTQSRNSTYCNCTIPQHIYSQFGGEKIQYKKYKESYVGVSKAHFNKLPKELTIWYTYTHRTPSKEVVVRGRRRTENIHLILGTHQNGIVQTDLSPPINIRGISIYKWPSANNANLSGMFCFDSFGCHALPCLAMQPPIRRFYASSLSISVQIFLLPNTSLISSRTL